MRSSQWWTQSLTLPRVPRCGFLCPPEGLKTSCFSLCSKRPLTFPFCIPSILHISSFPSHTAVFISCSLVVVLGLHGCVQSGSSSPGELRLGWLASSPQSPLAGSTPTSMPSYLSCVLAEQVSSILAKQIFFPLPLCLFCCQGSLLLPRHPW